MTDKCHNNKLFYLENPSALKSLPDGMSMKAYQMAKQKNAKEDFTSLIESELRERGMLD